MRNTQDHNAQVSRAGLIPLLVSPTCPCILDNPWHSAYTFCGFLGHSQLAACIQKASKIYMHKCTTILCMVILQNRFFGIYIYIYSPSSLEKLWNA